MAKIFDQGCHYDMILGQNLMNELGLVLNFNTKSMMWDGSTVAMCEYDHNHDPTTLATNLLLDVLDSRLEVNDSITMLDKPSDLHYQEKDVDPAAHLYMNPPIYRILWTNASTFSHYNVSNFIPCSPDSKHSSMDA